MRKLLVCFADLATLVCSLAESVPVIKVQVESPELDRRMLLDRLNVHGKDHGMQFELADAGYEYRIAFGTGQGDAQVLAAGSGGSMNTSAGTADVFDAAGKELFRFDRKNRWTDS